MSILRELHEHMCDDCFATWKHVDERCDRNNYRKVLTCNMCAPAHIWEEMARNMPIPHDHTCVICEREWGHNDKKCALEERYWLECKSCMTEFYAAKEYFCPKCARDASEIKDSSLSSVCYVCPHCQHYFYPQGDGMNTMNTVEKKNVYTAEGDAQINICEYVCPRCGTSNKGDPNLCAECGHRFRSYDSRGQAEEDEIDDYGPGFG